MHDALGHELSLLALRAGALELDPTLGESQRAAATELREGAAAATERLRAVIGVLRTDATAPLQPVEETLEALVDRVRRAGLVLNFPVGARDALPPLVDRAVYRVVQEALTNAARHAPGAPVTGRLTGDEEGVTVEVANPIDAPADASAPGTGLLGLAERVRLAGGTFHAGAEAAEGTATGTFRVVATVPRVPAGSVPEPAPESAGRLESARKRTRRGLVLTVVVPVLAGVLLVGVVLAGYVVETTASVVDPWDQLRIHLGDRKSTRLNSSHNRESRMPSSA